MGNIPDGEMGKEQLISSFKMWYQRLRREEDDLFDRPFGSPKLSREEKLERTVALQKELEELVASIEKAGEDVKVAVGNMYDIARSIKKGVTHRLTEMKEDHVGSIPKEPTSEPVIESDEGAQPESVVDLSVQSSEHDVAEALEEKKSGDVGESIDEEVVEREQKEKMEITMQQLKENSGKIIKAVEAILERTDLPSGLKLFESKDPDLAKLNIDVKKNLSDVKYRLSGFQKSGVGSPEEKYASSELFYSLRSLYVLLEADIEGELGVGIEQSLRLLFSEELRLLNEVLPGFEGYNKKTTFNMYHPKRGALFNERKDYVSPDGSRVRDEEIDRGRIVAITEPGIMLFEESEGGGHSETLRHWAKVVLSGGR